MPLVRTTIQPWVELDVDEQEYTQLKNLGLLIEDSHEDQAGDLSPTIAEPSAESMM